MSLKPYRSIANVAETPNTNLAVTDNFTGEVTTRVAMADGTTIGRGIAAAVEATEPMARIAAHQAGRFRKCGFRASGTNRPR